MKTELNINEKLSKLKMDLAKVNERIINPMASEDTILALHKTKGEIELEIKALELEIGSFKTPVKDFYKSLNESETFNDKQHGSD